jgi:thiol-disulfide isomerase/thioredoxin
MRLYIYVSILVLLSGCGAQYGATKEQKLSRLQRSDVPDESANKYTRPFDIGDFQKPIAPASPADIRVQEVNADNLRDMMKQSEYTWFVVWASWCPHCQAGIKEYYKTAAEFQSKGLTYVMVSEDYNLPAIQQLIFESGYRKQAYVLDPKAFGYDEATKVNDLRKAICPSCVDKDAVVPQHYIFNKYGKQVLYMVGGDVDRASIERALWQDKGLGAQE